MNASTRRLAVFAAVALMLAVALPTAQAQPPPPEPSPSATMPIHCPPDLLPILDWVGGCTVRLQQLMPWISWADAVVQWVRCGVVGGAAC